jgi:folliculin
VIYTLPQLVKVLGSETFRVVCYHAIVGNQIIVRGAGADMVVSVLAAMAHLLPRACAVMLPYADEYRDRWQCMHGALCSVY